MLPSLSLLLYVEKRERGFSVWLTRDDRRAILAIVAIQRYTYIPPQKYSSNQKGDWYDRRDNKAHDIVVLSRMC